MNQTKAWIVMRKSGALVSKDGETDFMSDAIHFYDRAHAIAASLAHNNFGSTVIEISVGGNYQHEELHAREEFVSHRHIGSVLALIFLVVLFGCGGGATANKVSTPAGIAAPNFTPTAGTVPASQTVVMSSVTVGASIFFTTDGSEPTTSSTAFTTPISLTTTSTTVKAIAVMGNQQSAVSTAKYVVEAQTQGNSFVQTVYLTCGFATPNLNCIDTFSYVGPSDAGSTLTGNFTQASPSCITDTPGDSLLIFTVSAPSPSYQWSSSGPAPTWGSFGINNGGNTPDWLFDTFGVDTTSLSPTQATASQPWLVSAFSATATGSDCLDFTFPGGPTGVPAQSIAQWGVFILEYANIAGVDIPSVSVKLNSAVSGQEISNPTISNGNDVVVDLVLVNGATALAGNSQTSRLSLPDGTAILLQDGTTVPGNYAPAAFVNNAPQASLFLSVGLKPQQ